MTDVGGRGWEGLPAPSPTPVQRERVNPELYPHWLPAGCPVGRVLQSEKG